MRTADHTPRRERQSARRTDLVGVACALTVAVLVGVCSAIAHPVESASSRWVPAATESQPRGSVSAALRERQEHLVGVHEPSARARLEVPRLSHKPTPYSKRFEPRHELGVRLEARFAALARTLLSAGVPTCHGRMADRPVLANCPAQGPPRTA